MTTVSNRRDRSRGPRVARAILLGILALAVQGARAQSFDCDEGLPLVSPDTLTVSFDATAPKPGNRLRWPDVLLEGGTCVGVRAAGDLVARMGLRVLGTYENLFDRALDFRIPDGGVIGSSTVEDVNVDLDSSPRNPSARSLGARLNLSGAGGVYVAQVIAGAESAVQRNQGIPEHLPAVNVTGFSSSGNTIYAAVTFLPVVRSDDGGQTWFEPAPKLTPPFTSRPDVIVASPVDPERVMIAVRGQGLWVSTDGGKTFARDTVLTPEGTNVTVLDRVTMRLDDGTIGERIYLGLSGGRLLYSDDGGVVFDEVTLPVRPFVDSEPRVFCGTPDPQSTPVTVKAVAVSPNDPSRLYIGVEQFGVYMTEDNHATWTPRNTELIRCNGDISTPSAAGATRTVLRLLALTRLDSGGSPTDVLLAWTETPVTAGTPTSDPTWFDATLMLSADGGLSWTPQTEGFPTRGAGLFASINALVPDPRSYDPANPSNELGVLAGTSTDGLWQLNLGDTGPARGVWVPYDGSADLRNPKIGALMALPSDPETILVGTLSSGVYEPGDEIDLTRAVNATSTDATKVERLGVSVAFDQAGTLSGGEQFTLRGQVFQAYAVWRARTTDSLGEPLWQMIGLYDLTNPEFCSPDACDAPALSQIVGCFADKRANCFTPPSEAGSGDGWWEFFDREVQNGFSYWYAVSTLDYGFTGDVQPENLDRDFVFSPRSPQESDPAALPFTSLRAGANYNTTLFEVNVEAAGDLSRVFAVPNPLVRRAGFDAEGASSVRIVNVTASSRVQIYSLAGDLIRELENVIFNGQERGNIKWDTRNGEGELVASGVYIYRVTDDDGNEVVDRLTIIR